jgi:TolB-like protein
LAALALAFALLWPRAPARPDRRRLALLSLRNLGGDAQKDWIGPALAEMLTTELGADGKLRLVSSEEVAHARRELSPEPGTLSPATLARVRAVLDADRAVVGSYVLSGGQLRVDIRIQDTTTGDSVAMARQGTDGDLVALATALSADLRAKLGSAPLGPGEERALSGLLPASTDAARLRAQGREKLFDRECIAARDLFEQAIAQDARFALAHVDLAEAWRCLGYEARAREEAQRAFELSDGLPRRQRMLIEARYRERTHDKARAVALYRTLHDEDPEDLEVGIALAKAMDNLSERQAVLASLRRLPSPVGDSPLIDLYEASNIGLDVEIRLAAAERAEAKARSRGAQGLLAEATFRRAKVLLDSGRDGAARRLAEESRELSARIGARSQSAYALDILGEAEINLGHAADAERAIDEAMTISRELGDRSLFLGLIVRAYLSENEGNLARALADVDQARDVARDVEDYFPQARATYLGAIYALRAGDAIGARRRLEETFATSRAAAIDPPIWWDPGPILFEEGQIDEATRLANGLLAFQSRNLSLRAETVVDYCDLIVASRPVAAAAAARLALGTLAVSEDPHHYLEVGARACLAWALAGARNVAEARVEIERVRPHVEDSEYVSYRAGARLALGRAQLLVGDTAAAKVTLAACLAEANRFSLVALALESRLTLGQIDHHRKALDDLAAEAQRRGFVRIARLASAR